MSLFSSLNALIFSLSEPQTIDFQFKINFSHTLIQKKGYSRKEAETYFKERKKGSQFSVVYKRLKTDLLEGILNTSLSQFLNEAKRNIKFARY